MLTEYSTYDDIRKFRDKAWMKFDNIRTGWMYSKINRCLLEWHRNSEIVKRGHYQSIKSYFRIDNQYVWFSIKPSLDKNGYVSKNCYTPCLITYIETNKGKMYYDLREKSIDIKTPHFAKRTSERYDYKYRISVSRAKIARYRRQGEIYEYLVYNDYIMITKRLAHDIVLFKTFLHRDIITGHNHKELIARAERGVKYNDIYEWK